MPLIPTCIVSRWYWVLDLCLFMNTAWSCGPQWCLMIITAFKCPQIGRCVVMPTVVLTWRVTIETPVSNKLQCTVLYGWLVSAVQQIFHWQCSSCTGCVFCGALVYWESSENFFTLFCMCRSSQWEILCFPKSSLVIWCLWILWPLRCFHRHSYQLSKHTHLQEHKQYTACCVALVSSITFFYHYKSFVLFVQPSNTCFWKNKLFFKVHNH